MSGRIPKDFIDDLIDRTDIGEIIASRIQLKKAGREYKACCPFHTEKSPSFTVSPDKGFYHCFGCGAHGNAVGFLMEHDRLEFVEAVEELASYHGIEVPREQGSQPQQSPVAPLLELLLKASELYRAQLRANNTAVDYLKKRGLDGQTAGRFQVGFAPPGWDFILKQLGTGDGTEDNLLKAGLITRNEEGRTYDRFRERIMFPIRDSRGRVVAFGGRILDSGEPKYLNSPETPVFHKGRELYGLFEARQISRNPERLLVVEGYMDVVALAQHGIDNAVATLGTATTPEHIQRLFRVTREIIFCFDGDRAGRQAAWRALQITLPELREGRQVRFLFLEEGEDPDSVVRTEGAEGFYARLDRSQPLSEYLIEQLKAETNLDSVDGLARLAELARPLVNRIPEGVFHDLLLDRLSTEVGLSSARLGELLASSSAHSQPDYPPAAARAPAQPAQPVRLSLIRKAIRLLLHKPAAATRLQIPAELENLHNPGIVLLTELLDAAADKPSIKPARLAQEFAGHPDGGVHLQTLLTHDLPLDQDADWAAELQGTLDGIVLQELERRLTELATYASLNKDQKKEFRLLEKKLAGSRSGPG
jgi:DNA primase